MGILGGTFDPVHNGHLHIAREVRRRFRLDEIWFLVARIPPHKRRRPIAPAWHRCSMVALATREDARFKICDAELQSASPYTFQTLRTLRKLHAGVRFYFIAGGDSLRELHRWRSFRSLLRESPMIFVARSDAPVDPAELDPEVGSRLRPFSRRDSPWLTGCFLIDVGAPTVSSTQIRRAAGGPPLRRWVPPDVYRYIRKHRLYESR